MATLQDFGFRRDNPGGEWLERKRQYAELAYPRLGVGSITAWLGMMNPYVLLKTSHAIKLRGELGEEKWRHTSVKYEALEDSVFLNGWDETTQIMIFVGYNGEASIGEGNHRTAFAFDNHIEWIRADIRYFCGAEEVEGLMNPHYLLENNLIKVDPNQTASNS